MAAMAAVPVYKLRGGQRYSAPTPSPSPILVLAVGPRERAGEAAAPYLWATGTVRCSGPASGPSGSGLAHRGCGGGGDHWPRRLGTSYFTDTIRVRCGEVMETRSAASKTDATTPSTQDCGPCSPERSTYCRQTQLKNHTKIFSDVISSHCKSIIGTYNCCPDQRILC